MSIEKIAILGAGNGGCAAAADLTLRGYEVRLFSRSEKTLLPIIQRGGIELVENGEEKFAAPFLVSSRLAPAVNAADLIIVAVPAVAHDYAARQLAPHLVSGQRVLLNPGHTGGSLHFANVLRAAGCKADIGLCETVTLTYICRMPAPIRVEVYRRTAHLRCAAFPGRDTNRLVEEIRGVFPNLVPARSVLDTGFSNINAIMHPAGMLGNMGWIERTGGDFYYYREGVTAGVAAWIEKVDEERRQVAARLGVETMSFVEIFHQAGLTSDDARRSGSVLRAINESEPNRTIKAPGLLDHRYLREDVGFGLLPMAEIGKVAKVKTPVIDALIVLASAANRIDYRREGLTLDGMGLSGVTAERLPRLLRDGFDGGHTAGA